MYPLRKLCGYLCEACHPLFVQRRQIMHITLPGLLYFVGFIVNEDPLKDGNIERNLIYLG
jgi:hypothetical protein